MPPTVGVAIVEALAANGVSTVFGIPGTHNIELYRGMQSIGVRHVLVRHEQGAAYAADGYARTSARPGVLVATSGPGIMNAVTGLANAYADSIPVLAISPGPPLGQERQDLGFLHEMKDQRAAVDQVVARSIRVESGEHAVRAVHETFARWRVERPRPVHLEVPHDLLGAPWTGAVGGAHAVPAPLRLAEPSIAAVVTALTASSRPLIVTGGGSRDDQDLVTAFAEALDAPVASTTTGKAVLDEFNPLSLGPAYVQHEIAHAIAECDLVVALGTELSTPGSFDGFTGKLIRVDLDAGQLDKHVRADLAIAASVRTFLESVLPALPSAHRDGRGRAAELRERLQPAAPARGEDWLQDLNRALMRALPDDTIVTGDSSQVTYLGTRPAWKQHGPRRFITTDAYSTLGYSLPAAIGAKIAAPDTPVVAIMGDGAAMFSIQELATAAQEGLALPVVIVDNHAYAEIKRNMQDAGMAPLGVDLDTPDFAGLARAMHCDGVTAATIDDVVDAVTAALRGVRPTVVSVAVPGTHEPLEGLGSDSGPEREKRPR